MCQQGTADHLRSPAWSAGNPMQVRYLAALCPARAVGITGQTTVSCGAEDYSIKCSHSLLLVLSRTLTIAYRPIPCSVPECNRPEMIGLSIDCSSGTDRLPQRL